MRCDSANNTVSVPINELGFDKFYNKCFNLYDDTTYLYLNELALVYAELYATVSSIAYLLILQSDFKFQHSTIQHIVNMYQWLHKSQIRTGKAYHVHQ